ncbi:MAG: hypothetical protein VCG02_13205 [Verrucomicrobiota bacterium]
MPAYIYQILHLSGLVLVFLSLGGAVVRSMSKSDEPAIRKLVGLSHGIGMLLVFIAGFALIAKTGVGFQIWVFIKIGIWILLAVLFAMINRKPDLARTLWYIVLFAAVIAIFQVYKGRYTHYDVAPDATPTKQAPASE